MRAWVPSYTIRPILSSNPEYNNNFTTLDSKGLVIILVKYYLNGLLGLGLLMDDDIITLGESTDSK